MTPKEYLEIEAVQVARIRVARAEANKSVFPENVRVANSSDIIEGAIIWHRNGDDGPFWNIVSEVLHPSDTYKAYCADDGCRYGLMDAFVEI